MPDAPKKSKGARTRRRWIAKFKRLEKKLPPWAVIALGSVLLLVGIVLLIIPGPGIPFVIAGFTLLATKVPWARKLFEWGKEQVAHIRKRIARFKQERARARSAAAH